jgi:hypothetical protein
MNSLPMSHPPAPELAPELTPAAAPVPGTTAPAVLDLEASGFGRASYPIEVGFVLPNGGVGCTLIRPEPGWTHWDASAERLHGIRRETAVRAGRSARDVAGWLNRHLSGLIVYCDGWAHDYPWLGMLFEAAGQRPTFRLEHLQRLLDDERRARWDAAVASARDAVGRDRHRASVDARALQRALVSLGAGT